MVGDELRNRGHKVEVINAAVPGHNSTDSLGKLLTDIWLLDPDLVFLCHTWNDVKYFSALIPANPYRGLPPLEPVSWEIDWRLHPAGLDRLLSVSSIYRWIRVALIQFLITEEGRNIQVHQAVPGVLDRTSQRSDAPEQPDESRNSKPAGPRQFALNLRLIAALIREIGAELVLCRQARLESGSGTTGMSVENYAFRNTQLSLAELERAFATSNEAIDSLAVEEDLEVVDIHAALSSEARFFHDGIHFSPEGSHAVSVFVADALEDNLRDMAGAAVPAAINRSPESRSQRSLRSGSSEER